VIVGGAKSEEAVPLDGQWECDRLLGLLTLLLSHIMTIKGVHGEGTAGLTFSGH